MQGSVSRQPPLQRTSRRLFAHEPGYDTLARSSYSVDRLPFAAQNPASRAEPPAFFRAGPQATPDTLSSLELQARIVSDALSSPLVATTRDFRLCVPGLV